MKQKKILITSLVIIGLLIAGLYIFRNDLRIWLFAPRNSNIERGVMREDLGSMESGLEDQGVETEKEGEENIRVVAKDLEIPWEITFLPSGEILVTERSGNLLKIGEDREIISEIEGVEHVGEGGLLGMALHPNFSENNWLYLYSTSQNETGLINRVERYQLVDNQLTNREIIIEQIPGASYHDGGRIKFGPLGYLWVTTGDAGQAELAQDTSSLAGKILRLNDDGSIPEDNPFDNAVYSYGHRNPQGLTWDDQGRLWATEHGPSGAQSGFDELNLIKIGGNYGWPVIRGTESQAEMIQPVIQSGSDETWAPAGAVYSQGSIFFTGLRGASLYEAKIEGEAVIEFVAHFNQEFGRLRALELGPNGDLYFTTSNTDGRGETKPGDDQIIRLNSKLFSTK